MPQLFQVLKCYKCSVFQVHQTKKLIKWECKLCGEKQSIKRHYGIGTGKECRLHVQKLNSVRGEVGEVNETSKQYENSDEEDKSEMKAPVKKQEKAESKWSEYVDKMEEIKVPEVNDSMYLENVEVVLEVPAKRRKFTKAKAKNASVSNKYPTKTDDFANFRQSPSPPPIKFYETQISYVKKDLSESSVVKTNDNVSAKLEIDISECKKKAEVKTFIPHKIDKNSKWAQFSDDDESGEKSYNDCDLAILNKRIDNALNKDLEIRNLNKDTDVNYNSGVPNNKVDHRKCNGERNVRNTDLPSNIFSLCDEYDLDDVLDF